VARLYRTVAEKQRLVDGFLHSGKPLAQYAVEAGVNAQVLNRWVQKIDQSDQKKTGSNGFIELTSGGSTNIFSPVSCLIEIESRAGFVVRINQGASSGVIAQVFSEVKNL